MPYYRVRQVIREQRDEAGKVVATWVEPQLGGGVSWRGDTDGTNYLLFCDQEVPGLTELTVPDVRAEVGKRPLARLVDVGRWSRGTGHLTPIPLEEVAGPPPDPPKRPV